MQFSPTIFLLLFSLLGFSQNKISGMIVDEFEQPVPFANILLYTKSGELTDDRGISNENGLFQISTGLKGEYYIISTSIGLQDEQSKAFSIDTNSQVKLGQLVMKEESFELNDVKVVGKKIPYKKEIDRTVIDLEDDSSTAGSSILDILERTPGLIVDRQNESISMLGKSGVQVMINGKLSYMPAAALVQFLNGINAENAKTVELITTPPAKFDAEGNAGFINIELKQNLEAGYNGNLTSSLSAGDRRLAQNGSLNFNVKAEKSNLVFNYSVNNNNLPISFEADRFIRIDNTENNSFIKATRDNNRVVQNLRFSYDVDLSEKVNIGTVVSGYSNAYRMTEDKNIQNSGTINSEDIYFSSEDNFCKNAQIGASVSYKTSEKSKLQIAYDYLKYDNDQPVDYQINLDNGGLNNQFLNLNSTKNSPFKIEVYALDFETDLTSSINFTSGLKYVSNSFMNRNELFRDNVYDANFANQSQLEEGIAAAYAQIRSSLGEKLTLQAGLRYEDTDTKLTSLLTNQLVVNREYGNFFPSLFLGYKLNDFNNLNFSYSKRINRPAFTDMAPFVYFVDINQAFQGNVALRASFTDNLQIDYRFKSINISLQYTDETDGVSRFQPSVDPESGFLTMISDNIDKQQTWSAILSYSFYPISQWNARFFTTLSQTILEDTVDGALSRIENSNIRFNLNNNFTLGNGITFQVWGFFQSRSIFGINRIDPIGSLNLSLQKKYKNLTYTLNGDNILDTQIFKVSSMGSELFTQIMRWDFRQPQIKFSILYNFGNQNLKMKKIKSAEEAKRIKV